MLKFALILLLTLPIVAFAQKPVNPSSTASTGYVITNIPIHVITTGVRVVNPIDTIREVIKNLEDYKLMIFCSGYYGTDTKTKIAEVQSHINSLKQYYNIK